MLHHIRVCLISSPFLRIRYAGVDPRILVLDGNYVKRVHRVQAHASVSDIIDAVHAANDEFIVSEDSDEL